MASTRTVVIVVGIAACAGVAFSRSWLMHRFECAA